MLITPLQLAVLAIWIAVLSERLLHVLIRTLAYLLFRSYKDREKGRAGLSLFAALINASFSLLSSSVGLALRTLASLFQWGSTVFVLLVVLGFLVLALEFSGHLMLALSTTWNYTLGPTAQVLVVWPLYVFNTIFNALAPIWNAWIWLWHKVPHQILVRTVTQDLGTIVAMGVEVTGLCRSLALSLVGWVGSFVCCLTPADFAASVSGQGICNPQCFEPGNRVMDLMTPMAHLRHFTVYAVIWLKNLCGTLSGPLDILTFPLMDIHFAQGVHFLTNAVLYLCTHLPAITTLRCGLFGAESAVMCIPDFEPVFQMLVAGCRAVGAGLDNWLDVGVLVVQSLLGLPAPECTAIPLALADVATRSALFGTNATAIVGMTAAMFARTDGVAVQYFSLSRDWQTVLHPYAFPFPVDVGLGVAAIAHISDLHHDAGGDDTMALLGCVCEDTDAGMQLQCGAAVFDDQVNATERFIPVVFQLASTARYMACSKAKISVQSLRWPASRTTPASVPTMDGTAAPDPTCVSSKGTCVQADAAVWVRPMCSADGNIDPVCLESFTQSGCFPYCMGLHVRGSVTQPIILHSAQEWTDGVTMLRRDCGLFATKAATLGDDPDNGGIVATASVRGTSTVLLPNSPYGLHARTAVTSNCTYNPYTISLHPRPPAYSAHASIALDDQPFAFMGDLALVARRGGVDASTGEPRWFVEVQRLFGSQQNEFTLIPLAQLIPASAPCTTPADCGNVIATCGGATGCLPAIPYTWDTHPRAYNPGTVTERYAFYATNPDLQPFEAMSYYCVNAAAGNQFTNKFQISAISSYGGIRIWRLNPYLYCPPNPFTGVSQCPTVGTAGSVQIAALNFTSFETALCTQEFFVFATGMDYINPDNIAVTVLRTTLANINTRTLQPLDPTQASYPVLWLNPTTLQWREGRMWAPEAASPALVAGQLCPSQRRTPNVGSIAAEALVSMGLLVRLPLNIVLGMPVVMSLINDKCPVLTRGHWMLKTCGAELLSLEDVFSSIYRANSLFFQGMAIIADGFGPGYPQTFINGLAMHLENGPFTPILPGFAKQLHSLGHVDPLKSLSAIQNAVGTLPAPVQAMQQALHSPIARAHFTYRLFARMLMNMLQAIGGGRTIGNLFWTTYADSLEDYHAIVSIRQRRACGGMALMAGYSTPMGRLTERWCSAYVSLEDGLLTMMAVFTVEVPLMACVCVQSAGLNFREHVLGRCFDDCPDLYKPLLAHLLTQYGDTPSAICPALTAMASTHFTGALDQMFADIESGTDQLASVIDSFITVGLDPQAGDCNNFQDNPYVITLIPEPVDYFRVCGLTSFCRTRCLSEFQAFEALNVAPPVYETVTETVRSPLFAALNPDAYNPLSTALALLELSNCTELCGTVRTSAGGARDRCFLVAGTDTLAEQRPSVIGYCVPVDVTAGVRRAGVSAPSDFPASTADAPLLDAAFVWRPDSAVDFWSQYRLVLMSATTMYQCGHVGGCTVLYALADLGPDVTQLVSFAALGNTLVQKARALDGVLPRSTEVRIFVYTLVELYSWIGPFRPLGGSNLWPDSDYAYLVCAADPYNGCPSVLIVPFAALPDGSFPPVRVCDRTDDGASVRNCASYDVDTSFTYRAGIPAPVSAHYRRTLFGQTGWPDLSAGGGAWSVFFTLGQTSHWLQVLTVTGATASASGSLPVDMELTVRRPCSISNCVGCASLGLQQVCYTAQQCQLARCIGTMVHQRRPLCAVGMNLAAMVHQQTALTYGAWLIVSETMVDVLALSTGGIQTPIAVTWPDQAFYGFICSAKDVSATGIAILTSAINGVVQSAAQTPVAGASLQSQSIDNRFFALFTMTSAAVTHFLHQLTLAPLYTLLATQKTMVCSANSVLSTVGLNSITVGDPAIQNASSSALGRCMSQYTTENMQGGGTGSAGTVSIAASAVGALSLSVGLEVLMHPLDASFTWLSGCVKGLQDVVQTLARSSCKLPDASVRHTFQCACNDTAQRVVPARAAEGVAASAHWCTTVMSMLTYDGRQAYVSNPFPLAELRAKLDAPPLGLPIDDYLACLADGGAQCDPPADPFFVRQQVSMVSVYQRCLANYQSRQWDLGTHALFNATLRAQLPVPVEVPPCVPVAGYACVGDCVLAARAAGSSPAGCLDLLLQKLGLTSLDYYQYLPSPAAVGSPYLPSTQVDACQAFTGPAALDFAGQAQFQACLNHYADTGACQLPLMVWSGRSSNRVPVAVAHATRIESEAGREAAARRVYRETRDAVQAVLLRVNSTWNANNVQAQIFSAEGDLLHQYFDCVMMGALDTKVDVWPAPDALNKPFWSRRTDGAAGRDFELPCSGAQLNDRGGIPDTQAPLTCGSHSRRSVIKYFLRDQMSSAEGTSAVRSILVDAVRALIARLYEAWVSDDNFVPYQCECANGTHAAACCVFDCTFDAPCACAEPGLPPSYACCGCGSSSLLPSGLNIPFTTIPGNSTLNGLVDSATQYMSDTVWRSNAPWLKYDTAGLAYFDWATDPAQARAAADHALFDTTRDVVGYSELGTPFGADGDTTIWDMCLGLVGQVHQTLPLNRATGRPTTLGTAFNPLSGTSATVNLTYTEDWVRAILADAYAKSPLYWHHSMRHAPSPSTMCQAPSPVPPVDLPSALRGDDNPVVSTLGWYAQTLGNARVDCYCGWWLNATHCQPPADLCPLIAQVAFTTREAQALCPLYVAGAFDMEGAMRDVRTYLSGVWPSDRWSCPALEASDHWGLFPDDSPLSAGRNSSHNTTRILMRGPSGLRVGSLASQLGAAGRPMTPFQRAQPVLPDPLQCSLAPPQSLVDHFVDDLFPAAQGVRQSAPVSYCLRFVVELARRLAYDQAGLSLPASEQTQIVATWQRRCEAKLNQTLFCEAFDIFALTGDAPLAGARCPFVVDPRFVHTTTAACLVVYQTAVYDPCLCDPAFCGPPVRTVNPITDLLNNAAKCRVPHPRDLVVDANSGLPPYPPQASASAPFSAGAADAGPTAIPPSLAGSQFQSQVLLGGLNNVANNRPGTYWPNVEGNASTQYCDLMVDWWPDAWAHPVGYHVTLPCTGAAHRTFDAAWTAVAVGSQVQMYYTPDALRDRNRSTSAFGASGLCRSHSVAMPMDILNPIRLCTQADNQPADPMVPAPRAFSAPQWGPELCSGSPFDVPWDPVASPLAPASVGTLPPGGAMALLQFNGWNVDGPQPLRQCATGADCCPTCSCLLTPTGGVCAVLQKGVFECLAHAHCAPGGARNNINININDTMCGGDGLCTRGVMEVTNSLASSEPVAFRTYSSNCSGPGLHALDTWGISKEEVVPDILNASGMCSYRSWYEHRQLVQQSACSASQCTLQGTDVWNFTDPGRSPRPAFEAGVLHTRPHACDVDYEHLAGLQSCAPVPAAAGTYRLVDANGNVAATLLAQSNRTRTYRLVNGAAQLPVVRHPNTASNPGAGFLGPDLSYTALGYDTYSQASAIPSARPRLCSSLALCSTQSAWNLWFVNGVQEPARFVPVSGGGGQRAYSTTDMIACGSMGYLVDSGTTTCQIDPGVAPLFAVTCQATPTAALCQTYPGGRYTSYRSASSLGQLAASLNALLVSVTTPASDWPSYLTAVGNADTLYPKILAQRPSPVYWYSTGTPTGVYYLAEYAAYEVPYAWWFRCTWLMGVRPSATLTPCAAWDAASAATPNINDADGAPVFDTATASSSSGNNVPLLQWLASLGAGVFTQATVNAARDAAHTAFANLVATQKGVAPPARYNFGCRASARLRADLLSKSGDYAQAVLANLNRRWSTAVPNLCDGFATCLDHGPVALVPGLNLFADVLARITPLGACPSASGCACTTSLPSAQQVCAYMQDSVPSQMPAVDPQQTTATPTLPLFKAPSTLLPTLQSQNAFAGLAARYDTKPDGCNTYPNYNCRDPAGCQCLFPTVQPNELAAAGLSPTDVQPNAPAVVAFGTSASIYVCGGSPLSSPGARCDLQSAPPSDVCVSESQTARTTMALYCDSLAAKGVAMFSAFNPASEQCLMSACFGGARIGGTRISIPPGVGVDVVSALSIPCYTLSCPGNPSNDKRVVLNPTPFTFNVFTQYRFYVLQIDYTMPDVTHTQRIHRAQLLDGRTNTVLANIQNHVCANMYGMSTTVRAVMEVASALSQSTPFPIFICTPNARNTRSKGRDFETKRHKTAGYLSKERTPAKWDQIMVDMVNAVEVGIDSSSEFSDAGILCGLSLPNNLKACNFSEPVSSPTAPRISDSLAIALACSDKDTLAACNELGATMCAQESNVRTYDKVKCTAARAGVALLVLGGPLGVLAAIAAEVGVNELPVCYQGQTPFEKCMNSYKDLGTCRSKFQIKCNWYMYQRDINESPCTSTAGQCSYDERYQDRTWEQQYKDAGLPTAGFCPACTGPLCPPSKDSSTFFLAQSATGLHTLTTRAVQDGDTLPAAAQHARIRLGTVGPPGGSRQAAQCSSTPIQCQSSIHRPVQYRLGLQTCVPCFAAPAVQCTGTHMCGFYASDGNDDQNVPGNPTTESFPDYATALQDAINTAQATLSSLRAGLRPLWRPWLAASGAFLQQGYNPSVLFQGFNAAILQLNGQCQIGGQLPDPSQCQNDGPRRAVRTHVQSQYKLGEGAVVPPGATLSYYVPASLLTGTNLAAWDSTARGAPFLQALLNDSVCAQFTYESLVCIQQPATGVTMLLNPLIAGDFEVRVGCDATLMDGTTRAISSSCNQLACSTASASSDRYNSYVNGGDGTASWTACKLKDHQLATDYTTRRDAPTNLCYKRPATPSRCGVPQGAQAQWGRAGAPVSTLYGYAGASPPNRSTLLQLATGATRNLGVSPWDLGGHHIRLTLSADGALRVTGLPLRSSATLAIAQAMNGTMAWPAQWAKQAAQRVVSATQCRSWACPFRRRFYWTGQRQASTVVTPFAAFGPTVPDAARTQAVYGTTSHPSAPFPSSASTVLSQLLSDYRTSNGFCACPAGSAQLCVSTFYSMRPPGAAFTPNASPCSQAELVNALLDLQPRTASVLNTSNSTCTYQLDWPWPGGPLRDGSWLPSGRVPPASCGALDRLPPFRYRFNNSRTKLPAADGATTLDEGGDCHMGRAARAASVESLPALATCVVTAKTADRVTLACPDGSTPTLPRPTSASVLNSASQAARRPCGTCDPLPAFFAGANNQSLPTPETSYGRPWRWSASRLLARDLRFKLCGNDTRCPAVQSQAWTTANFWPKMAAGTLFRPTPAPDALNTRLQTQRQRQQARGLGPDAASWDEPWLLCTTNASGRSCSGSISKADWLSGNRPDLCRAVLAQPNAPSAAVDLSICDLDASLNSLCSVIQQARYDVFEANCQLTGQCRTTSFFYQPATYALDDSAFVRSVVGTFYNFTSPGSCPVLDDETQAVLASNRQAVQGCPAQDLEVFNYAIQIAREALHSFVIIGYYSGMIFVDLIALITATDTTPLVNSILAYFNRIASEFQQFFAAFGDLVYKMVMETGKLGKALKAIITALCAFMREIFYPIVRPFMCAIQSFAIVIFDTLSAIIEGVSFLVGGALNGLAEGLTKASDAINSFSMCNAENPFHCDTLFPPDTNGPTSLPMPTRCWVGYIPAAGDRPQDGLGCSASDTCMDDDGSLRACGACVASLSGASYACDSLTKLCRCHVVAVGKTQCSSHQECALPSTECGFVDAYLQPSFGNVLCGACTSRPMCLVASAGAVGHCVCTLRPTSYQACSQVGMRIMPDPTQLCLVSLASSAFSASSSTYSAGWPSLAAAQCALLNQAQTYCLNVFDGSVDLSLVVGLSMLSASGSRRRLLLLPQPALATDAPPLFLNHTAEWLGATEPCRSLMLALLRLDEAGAGGGGLPSITDAYTASECQRWRDIGERAVVYFNLSHVDPVAFVSLSGLADAVGRNPEAARQVARVLPRLLAFLVAHDPLAQPLSLLALRLWQRLPSVNTTHIEEAISAQLKAMGSNHTARFELPDLVLRHYHHHHHNYSPPPPPHPLYSSTRTPHRSRPADATANTTALDTSAGEPQRGRKLLQAESWKESLAAVRQYSIQIVSGDAAANTVPYDIAAQWSKGPFVWPPDYSTNTAASSECLLASILFNYTLFTAKSTLAYYTGGEYPHPPVERTFKGCLPRLPDGLLASTRNLSSSTSANPGFVSTQLIPGLNGLASTALGLDTDYLLAYMSMQQPGNRPSQLSQDITIVFTCDFNSVQHCTHFRRDLGWGALIVTLGLGIVSYMAKTVGVPYADPLLFLTFIPLVSVFVFGVSPFCAPMVSTCFVDELHNLATYLLPSSLSWPDMLQYYPDCINGAPAPSVADAWRARSAACFRPCTDWPFSFHDPRDSVAWLTLRLGLPELPTTTDALAGHLRAWGIPPELIAPMFAVLPESLLFMGDRYDAKRPYLTWADMRDAQDTCFGLTIFQLVLLVVGIVGLGLVLIAALVLPLLIAQFAVTLLVSVFVFVHV